MTGHDFFDALEGWAAAPQAGASFDQVLRPPLAQPAAALAEGLFRATVERLLAWLEVPAGPGAAWREWRPLYQLAAEIDPHYVTREQLAGHLRGCPSLDAGQRDTVLDVLQGFFQLRREGFPPGYPDPLIPELACARWVAVFPERFGWASLDILRANGLYPLGSRAGFRARARFEEGLFDRPRGEAELRGWWRACGENGGAEAHRRDFVAAAFAGAHPGLGLESYCLDVPRCRECPLGSKCRWAGRRLEEGAGAEEVWARLEQGKAAELSTGQVIQAIFGLSANTGRELGRRVDRASLRRLSQQPPGDLEEWLEGTGVHRQQMEGLYEFSRRFGEERLTPGVPLASSETVYRHFRSRLRDMKQEQFLVVLLDSRKRFLGDMLVSQGTLTGSPVHPREVFHHAIRQRAASMVIVHNHPSGDPEPSPDDVAVTRRLVEAGAVLGIPVVDHVIVAGEEYFSFQKAGMM